uniref:PX domain-containing protein n=1 Tax=Grammatophora oceanica TaxID=210454 RepID=A0A7S1UTI8_9STRA|mmetsp:Transcript_2191/g.2963  ORF Transcript_2191/g.2963 Transcript_2191/m.2963 type:complete len:1122 (+) Transcript_2191:82-3447(+)
MMVASDKTRKGGWRKRLFNNRSKHHHNNNTKNDPGSPTRTKSSLPASDTNALKSIAPRRTQPQHEIVVSDESEQSSFELPQQRPKPRKKKAQPFADFVFPDESFSKGPFGDGLDQSVHSIQSSIYSESDTESQREAEEELEVDEDTFANARRQTHDRLSKARQILTRPFGRQDLPQARPWVIEVSPAEWDANENRWKYRVLVQRRVLMESSDDIPHSFTTAFTWRSLADFLWLEEALKAEFHGALMLPLLSIAIGTPNLLVSQDDAQHDEVDASLLRDWFADVLNGIRGQGELVLHQQVDIISSEAMEAFLYRNTNPKLPTKKAAKLSKSPGSLLTTSSQLDNPWRDSPVKELQEESFVQSLWVKPLLCGMDSLCGAPPPPQSPQRTKRSPLRSRTREGALVVPLDMGVYSSRALNAGPSLEQTDSFVPFGEGQESSSLAIHSELLEAERELVLSYRHSAMTATERLRSMTEQENQIGAGWKRLGEALSSLFNFEKDVESTKLLDLSDADKKKKIKHPYRKLGKGTVDDLLRAVVRQRLDRSTPCLSILSAMLSAYVGDLSAVAPSIKAYMDAITQLAHLDQVLESSERQALGHHRKNSRKRSDWSDSINALASNFDDVKKKVTRSFSTNSTETSTVDPETADSQRKQFEGRVRENERMLRESVTALCKATPIRAARMAHMFLSSEAAQAQLLNSSALSMRAKMNVADQKTIAGIKKQHIIDNKEDNKFELGLIKRIVEIGSPKKPVMQPEFDENGFPIIQDVETENSDEMRRDRAMELARERAGMWDSDLAMAIMEACGIQDAEVQVEETTRDLRRVRRQAIGLRENVDRCSDAIKVLRKVVFREEADFDDGVSVHTGHPVQPVHETRNEFWDDMSAVFSAAMNPPSNRKPRSMLPSVSLLGSAGIATNDPTGWVSAKRNGKCREASQTYLDTKDCSLNSFLNDLEVMLHDYEHRIECIESFVYMQCVGIQLEKHFSMKRTDALTAFEKKTDITTAINIANRKKLPRLVAELQAKMEKVAPNVSATTVKESKESHLLSKQLKTELSDLANRRFQRVRECSLDRVVSIITAWAKYEETAAKEEIKAVGGALDEIEKTLKLINVKADGISHALFAPGKKGKP